MKEKKKVRMTLALKLIPAIAVALILVSVVNILFARKNLKDEILEQISNEDAKLVEAYRLSFELIAADSTDSTMIQNFQDFIDKLAAENDFAYVLFMADTNGEVTALAHSNHERVGIVLDDAGSIAAARDGEKYCDYYTSDTYGLVLDVLTPLSKGGQRIGAVNIGVKVDSATVDDLARDSVLKQTLLSVIVGIIALVIMVIYLILAVIRPVKRSTGSLNQIIDSIENNHGDFGSHVFVGSHDEVGELGDGINKFIGVLAGIIGKIKSVSGNVYKTSEEINSAVQHSNDNATNISAAVEELYASMENISATSKEMIGASDEVAEDLDMIVNETTEGNNYVNEMQKRATKTKEQCVVKKENIRSDLDGRKVVLDQAIEDARKVEEISSLTNDILSIASQTNLLALNASIEAARAGEAGRGFAVVAEEISKLADSSRETASNIQEISNEVVSAVENLMSNASELINNMGEAIDTDYDSFKDMSDAYYDDAAKVQEFFNKFNGDATAIRTSMSRMSDSIKNVTDNISECTSGTSAIAESVEGLVSSISHIMDSSNANSDNFKELASETEKFM